jgi:hypothetical protein
MTPPLEDVDVRAAIRRGRDHEFDGRCQKKARRRRSEPGNGR